MRSTRKAEVVRERAPGLRSGFFSGSPSFFSTFAGSAGGAPLRAFTSISKIVSPRSAVRYCTTSFHCCLYSSFCSLLQG